MIRLRRVAIAVIASFLIIPFMSAGVLANLGHVIYCKSLLSDASEISNRLYKASELLKLSHKIRSTDRNSVWLLMINRAWGQLSRVHTDPKTLEQTSLNSYEDMSLLGFDVSPGVFLFEGEFPIIMHLGKYDETLTISASIDNLVQNGGFEHGVGLVMEPFWPWGYETVYYYRRSMENYELKNLNLRQGVPNTVMCISNPDQSRWPALKTKRIPVNQAGLYLVSGWIYGSEVSGSGDIKVAIYPNDAASVNDYTLLESIPVVREIGDWDLHAKLLYLDGKNNDHIELWLTNFRGFDEECFDDLLLGLLN